MELGQREAKGFTQHRFAVPMAHLAADVIPANLTIEGLRAVAGCLWHQLMRLSWGAAPLLPHTATRFALGSFSDVGRADLLPLWIVASVLRYRWSIKGYDERGSVLRANLAVGIAYMCVASCSTAALPERMPGMPLLDRSALL